MATLRERQRYRQEILQALYVAAEGNRLLGSTGAALNHDLRIPEQDLAAACSYLAGGPEGPGRSSSAACGPCPRTVTRWPGGVTCRREAS